MLHGEVNRQTRQQAINWNLGKYLTQNIFNFQIYFFQLDIMHSKNAIYSIYDVLILSKTFLFGVDEQFQVTQRNN